MDTEARLEKLENEYAKLAGRHMALTTCFSYLLNGELTAALTATLRERQIATALQTQAPDVYVEALTEEYVRFESALVQRSNRAASGPQDQP